MPIFRRLVYSAYVFVAVNMVVMLLLSVAEGVGAGRDFDIQALMRNPVYLCVVYLGSFAAAPALSARMRISGDDSRPTTKGNAPFGYAVRSLALVFTGLALAAILALVLFMLSKFA